MVIDKNNRIFSYVLILLIIINLFAMGVSSAEGPSDVREKDDILGFLENGVFIMFILIIVFLAVLVIVLYRWSGKVK